MKLLLPFKSNRLDYDLLTATPQTVRKGKRFVGEASAEVQEGALETRDKVISDLPLNGRVDIPVGIYDDDIVIHQTSLSIMDGATVYPTSETQTVTCKNKYMEGDVFVSPLTGLVPENIKKGVVIQGIKGTYEGYGS